MIELSGEVLFRALHSVASVQWCRPSFRDELISRGLMTPDTRLTDAGKQRLAELQEVCRDPDTAA